MSGPAEGRDEGLTDTESLEIKGNSAEAALAGRNGAPHLGSWLLQGCFTERAAAAKHQSGALRQNLVPQLWALHVPPTCDLGQSRPARAGKIDDRPIRTLQNSPAAQDVIRF